MTVTGIIAEFNPFHSGHKYLIDTAKRDGAVVCALSGSFVQRGDTAVISQRKRAAAALCAGADLIIGLPVCWSLSTSQSFALGGVYMLMCAGCTRLMFGSECGDTDALIKTADILSSDGFSQRLSAGLKRGITFAAARERAAAECGAPDGVLAGANDNLAVEYIIAARRIGWSPELVAVKRLGASHDSQNESGGFASASLLRKRLLAGDIDFCKKYIPPEAFNFGADDISDIHRIETAVLAVLRTRSREELEALPDLSEGLQNKLFSSIRLATGLEELYNSIKVKRYTHARVRRLVLSAFLGITKETFLTTPPYLRVLGFSAEGSRLLKDISRTSPAPVVTRVSDFTGLSDTAKAVFATECRAADLYNLSLFKPLPCGEEYTAKILKTEC